MISPPILGSGKQWFVESVPPVKEETEIIDQMSMVKKKLCEKTKEELVADHNADEQLIPGCLNVFKKENGLWHTMVTAKDNMGHGPHKDGVFNSSHTEEEAAKMWDDVTELINSETPSGSLNLTEGLKLPVLQQQMAVQTWILQSVEEKLAALAVLQEKNSDK